MGLKARTMTDEEADGVVAMHEKSLEDQVLRRADQVPDLRQRVMAVDI